MLLAAYVYTAPACPLVGFDAGMFKARPVVFEAEGEATK